MGFASDKNSFTHPYSCLFSLELNEQEDTGSHVFLELFEQDFSCLSVSESSYL